MSTAVQLAVAKAEASVPSAKTELVADERGLVAVEVVEPQAPEHPRLPHAVPPAAAAARGCGAARRRTRGA